MSLSFSQINASLCFPTATPYSLNNMSAAAGFSTPDAVSEFIGYTCPPPTTCYLYDVYDYGYADFVDCIGTPTYTYTVPGDFFCVSVWYSGPAYNTSLTCI